MSPCCVYKHLCFPKMQEKKCFVGSLLYVIEQIPSYWNNLHLNTLYSLFHNALPLLLMTNTFHFTSKHMQGSKTLFPLIMHDREAQWNPYSFKQKTTSAVIVVEYSSHICVSDYLSFDQHVGHLIIYELTSTKPSFGKSHMLSLSLGRIQTYNLCPVRWMLESP